MNKKGLSYVDWSISIGIFVIFVLILFILIIPSLDRRLDGNYLVSVAETGLKETSYHYIYKLPLFIDSTGQVGSMVSVNLPNYPTDYEGISVINQDFNEINNNINSELIFGPVTLSSGVSEFSILFLDSSHFSPGSPSGVLIDCGLTEFDCTFGVEKKLVGFSENKLNNLFGESCEEYTNYMDFKEAISYPEQKEISVSIYSEEDTSNYLYNCTFNEPSTSDLVYALSWRDKILKINEVQEDVIVLVRTW